MIVRPGPAQIDAGTCPGGVVIHVYEVPAGRLLHTSSAATQAEASWTAGRDADAAIRAASPQCEGFCLVGYDGDSGERIPLRDVLGIDQLP